jgi:hypothetical protein
MARKGCRAIEEEEEHALKGRDFRHQQYNNFAA